MYQQKEINPHPTLTNPHRRENGVVGGSRQDMVTASGTTTIGMDEVVFEIDFLENTSLYIEEVYISSQDEVEADAKILKFTEESIAAARAELEEALQNASLSYRSSVISTGEKEIQAQYTYNQAVLTASQAQEVYDDTLAKLLETLNQAKSQYDDAQEAYDELYQQIVDNSFYADYEVEEKKKAYDEALELYVTKLNEWGLTEDDLSGSSLTSQASGMGQSGGQSRVNSEEQWKRKAAELLKEEAEETEQEYEQAHEEYLETIEQAELNLKKRLNELEQAKALYTEADLAYQKELMSAKTTYQTALAKNQTAQNEYDTQLTSLSEELDKLKDEMDEAQENLDTFEALVGDGYLYTEEAGTVLMLRVREDEVLAGGDMIMAYSKSDEITVAVSVTQDSIAEITVGDTATVIFSEYGTYSGTITSINPVSSSNSRTSVTYTVEVSLDGDVSELEANLTATVMFGETSEGIKMPNGTEKPEEMELPSDGERQQRMNKQEDAKDD